MNYFVEMDSPICEIVIVSDGEAITTLHFVSEEDSRARYGVESSMNVLLEAKGQLQEYFDRKRRQFDLPLRLQGTEFQHKVWNQLLEIPYGVCTTYGDIAARIQKPLACRAVGLANGRNPIAIIVPCHRVIGANGALTGYACGIDRKKFLLDLETADKAVSGVTQLALFGN